MKKGFTLVEVMVVLAIISIVFVSLFRGFLVSETKASHALTNAGYSNVEVVDRAIFFIGMRGGEKTDAVRFKATALNPAGKPVEVYVFVGWPFKGATIRGL